MNSLTDIFHTALETTRSWAEGFVALLPNIVVAVLLAAFTAWLARSISQRLRDALGYKMDNQAAAGLLGRLAGAAVVGAGLFAILSVLHLDKTVTSLLAGLGVAGVALGFALKETAANFMSGLMMAIQRPFAIGDSIRVADHEGVVEAIALQYTRIRTYDGLSLRIPNQAVMQNSLLNITETCERRVELDIGVAYSDDLELVERVLCEAVAELPGRDRTRDVAVIFTGFGDSSIDAQVRFWLERAETPNFLAVRSDAIKALRKACDANDITIPFPIRTLDFGAGPVGGNAIEDMKLQIRQAS